MKDSFDDLLKQQAPVLTDTQERIIQAALELFAEHGYTAATSQTIAKHAGFTERTLFRHFRTKQQLFAQTIYPAMVKALEISVLQNVIAAEQPSLAATLQAIIENRLTFIRQNPDIFKLLAQELLLNEDFREFFFAYCNTHLLPAIRLVFKRAQERGELRDLPDAAVLRSLLSLTIGYAFNRLLITDGDWDESVDIQVMLDILLHGIGMR